MSFLIGFALSQGFLVLSSDTGNSAMDYSYGKARRILVKREFDEVFENGKKIRGKYLLAFIRNSESESRLGTIVSKKWGNAVRRNRIKRLMRESFRLSRPTWDCSFEIVLLPRSFPREVKLNPIMADFQKIIGRYLEFSKCNPSSFLAEKHESEKR